MGGPVGIPPTSAKTAKTALPHRVRLTFGVLIAVVGRCVVWGVYCADDGLPDGRDENRDENQDDTT